MKALSESEGNALNRAPRLSKEVLSDQKAWHVAGGRLVLPPPGGLLMAASCHHRRGQRSMSACGGCYARLHEALAQMRNAASIEEARAICDAVFTAMEEDASRPAPTPRRRKP